MSDPTEQEARDWQISRAEMNTNAVLAVERTMTEAEREKFLGRMTERNLHLRGAAVADILDMLYESDSYLGVVEPFYEANEALWTDHPLDVQIRLSIATRAAVVLLELERAAFEHVEPPEAMLPMVRRLAGVDA
jgi:hypothetical protein